MFQSVAADLVEDFCGKFLEDVDKKQLNVSMWNGVQQNIEMSSV